MKMQIIKILSQLLTIILFLACFFIAASALRKPFKASKIEMKNLCGCHTYKTSYFVTQVAFIHKDTIQFGLGKNQMQRCKEYLEDYIEGKKEKLVVYNSGALLTEYADCYSNQKDPDSNRKVWYTRIFDYSMPISGNGKDELKEKRPDIDTCDIKADKYGDLLRLPMSERNPFIFIILFIFWTILVSKLIQR